ncbi:MAG: hypothetical protein Kow0077_30930 [Anaerolineae bacterium]
MKKIPLNAFLVAILLVTSLAFSAPVVVTAQDGPPTPHDLCAAATPADTPDTLAFDQPEDVLEDGVDYLAVFCTTAGPILIDLFEEQTPITVNNFVFLARQGYYNNTNFHRVIPDFMAQGGDPTNTGSGGPGYQFEDEIVESLTFDRPGLLAMANAGPGTNGSQFFITTVPTDWLNGNHTIFGEVLAGQNNVLSIRNRDPQQALEPGTLLETVLIIEGRENVAIEEETLTLAGLEDAEAAMETLDRYVTTILDRFGAAFQDPLSGYFTLNADLSGVMDTAAAAALIEGAQTTALDYFASHGHLYSLSAVYTSTECDLEGLPIAATSYRLDAYPTVEDAAAALADPVLTELQIAQGYELYETDLPLPYNVYTRAQTDCDQETVAARAFVQRGRFVTMQEVVVTAENADIAPFLPEAFAMPLFEDALHTLFRPERQAG